MQKRPYIETFLHFQKMLKIVVNILASTRRLVLDFTHISAQSIGPIMQNSGRYRFIVTRGQQLETSIVMASDRLLPSYFTYAEEASDKELEVLI